MNWHDALAAVHPTYRPVVKRLLELYRRRYHALPKQERPALSCPSSALGLLTAEEMLLLGKARCWLLPPAVLSWVKGV